MKILIVGASGLIGSAVDIALTQEYGEAVIYRMSSNGLIRHVTYASAADEAPYDFIIDCDGNASRRDAENDPRNFFWKTLQDLQIRSQGILHTNYIFISSSYANSYPHEDTISSISQLCSYGRCKLLSEYFLKEMEDNLLILRPALVIGEKMRKGVIFDILTENKSYKTPLSTFNIITARALAGIIQKAVKEWGNWKGKLYNIGSRDEIWVKDIASILGREGTKFGEGEEDNTFNVDKIQKQQGLIMRSAKDYLIDFVAYDLPRMKA